MLRTASFVIVISTVLPSFALARSASAVSWVEAGGGGGLLLAQAQTQDVITTKDGKVHAGKILRETAKGYLFKAEDGSTSLIEFEQIADLQSSGAATTPAAGADSPAVAPPIVLAPPSAAEPAQRSARVIELEEDLEEVREASYGLGGPITMLAIGVPALVVGLVLVSSYLPALTYTSTSSSSWSMLYAFTVVGVLASVLGVVFTTIGTIRLIKNIVGRSGRASRIESLEKELALERQRPQASLRAPPAPLAPGQSIAPPMVVVPLFATRF